MKNKNFKILINFLSYGLKTSPVFMLKDQLIIICLAVLMGCSLVGISVQAIMISPNYRIEADVLNYGGSEGQSPNLRIFDSLGDWVSGLSNSNNYIAQVGFPYQVNTTITLVLDSNTKSLGTLTPGTPVEATTNVEVTTDAANGYSLAANYSGKMSSGPHEIDDFSGTIAVPQAWSGNCPNDGECGFGFTVSAGTGVEAKWGSGSNYAAFPGAATEIHRKTGYTGGSSDATSVRYRADVLNTQTSGAYQTTVTYTATAAL